MAAQPARAFRRGGRSPLPCTPGAGYHVWLSSRRNGFIYTPGLLQKSGQQRRAIPMMPPEDKIQVHWHEHAVSRKEREEANGYEGGVVWFTGLSGSGKSTVANLVDHKLHSMGVHSFVLDGDNIRHGVGLNAAPGPLRQRHGDEFAQRFGLGFSAQDREENIRRIGAVA